MHGDRPRSTGEASSEASVDATPLAENCGNATNVAWTWGDSLSSPPQTGQRGAEM